MSTNPALDPSNVTDGGLFPTDAVQDAIRLNALHGLGILDTPADRTFDSIVAAAREVCETPIALVSLVDGDRQWFKARVGFEPPETTLDRSVCVHTLGRSDPLVIPDLTLDARSAANPLVTGPESIRFYVGVPLVTSDGQALGALCVIDTVPRLSGLTDKQTTVLRHLAQQVITQIEMRQLLAERDALVERLRVANEQAARGHKQLASLFDHAPSFMALQRGPDHVFEMANAAHRQTVGGRDVVGFGVREALPDAVAQGYADILDEVYTTGLARTMRAAPYTPQPDPALPAIQSFLDIHYQPVMDDGQVVGIFTVGHDVTAHVDQARRQAAMVELGEHFRTMTDSHAVILAASEIMARTLGATRAGIGTVDPEAETVLMHENWRQDGAVAIEGLFRFRDYGTYIDDLKAGETVIVEDVTTDPRTMANAEAILSLGIRVLLNFPVIERGRFVMVAFVHFADLHPLSAEDILFVRQVADRTQAALARLQHEEQRQVLHLELAHRMKNMLAVVKAITSQTLRQAESADAGRTAIEARLGALARAQDILTSRLTFEEADAVEVIEAAIAPHRDATDRITLDGPHLSLTSQQAIGLSLAIHELATNAAKYGALSNAVGRVSVDWCEIDGGFWFRWVESDGPPVVAPTRRGFGSRLLERVIAANFDAEARLDHAPEGVRFTLGSKARDGGTAGA